MLEKGRATIVTGVQFGDEGKGKIVDVLSADADLVCRVQGGNNAGHTIWIGDRKVVTHLLPSGILRPEKKVAIGAGVVLDPVVLVQEIEKLRKEGVPIDGSRLWLDPRAHIIMPLHKLLERKSEDSLTQTGAAIGTTGRGIGPTYASRANRNGPRVCDLVHPEHLEAFLSTHVEFQEGFTSEIRAAYAEAGAALKEFVTDVALRANDALEQGARVLIEGAQGAMLDVAFGTYPFVTSSSLISGSAAGGLGISPTRINRVVGVIKAYMTRVGNGPFPSELEGQLSETLREKGKEYGATTGRPRRVGWLDLVALRYFARLNGITDFVLMKSDVLDGFESVGVLTDYVDKKTARSTSFSFGWPIAAKEWEQVEPVVEFFSGWEQLLNVDNTLNVNFRTFVGFIEDRTKVPVRYVSSGPERSEGIWL